MIRTGPRANTEVLISFGDCAVTGNVTALRNPLGHGRAGPAPVYLENGDLARRRSRTSRASCPAAGPGAAGPRGRAGRRLPAGLPAAGRRASAPCWSSCSPASRPHLTGREIKFG